MNDKKAEIYRCGKELFAENGFKDTNVAQIMRQAGYATGTFYRYYPSKDALFMEIYNEENIVLKKAILNTIDITREPMLVMQEMTRLNYEGMKQNPILREWYNRESFDKIERSFRETDAMNRMDFLYDCFIEVVRQWQKEGRMRADIDAGMIMALFTAYLNIDLHKEEIGLQYFPALMEHMGEFLMRGLMDNGGRNGKGGADAQGS